MRSDWFPGGVGCAEENHGVRGFPWVSELVKLQQRQF